MVCPAGGGQYVINIYTPPRGVLLRVIRNKRAKSTYAHSTNSQGPNQKWGCPTLIPLFSMGTPKAKKEVESVNHTITNNVVCLFCLCNWCLFLLPFTSASRLLSQCNHTVSPLHIKAEGFGNEPNRHHGSAIYYFRCCIKFNFLCSHQSFVAANG